MVLKIRHVRGSNLLRWKEPEITVEGVKTHGGGSRTLRWWESDSTVEGVFAHPVCKKLFAASEVFSVAVWLSLYRRSEVLFRARNLFMSEKLRALFG